MLTIFPNDPRQLPAAVYQVAYADGPPVTKPFSLTYLGDHIPLRSNSALLERERQAGVGGHPYMQLQQMSPWDQMWTWMSKGKGCGKGDQVSWLENRVDPIKALPSSVAAGLRQVSWLENRVDPIKALPSSVAAGLQQGSWLENRADPIKALPSSLAAGLQQVSRPCVL